MGASRYNYAHVTMQSTTLPERRTPRPLLRHAACLWSIMLGLPPDIHIYTSSKQAWIQLSADAPIVDEYYDRKEYWPAASLDRRRVLLSSSS
jgi:hypothetical protein